MSDKPRVGYVGAGLMGHGAAKNILLKGYALSVLGHRNRIPVDDLVARGANEVLTPAALVAASDVVFLCLPSSTEVEHIMLGAQGIIAAARPDMVVVDSTTADPNSTRRLGAMLAEKGCGYVDGPLSRTPNEAEMGRLSTYLAGEPAHLARVRPIIETYAEVIIEVGDLGAAHTMKLVNNLISIGTASVIAEAVATAHRLGVNLRKLFEMVSAGPANSAMFQAMMPWVLNGDSTRMRASLRIAAKDMRLICGLLEDAPVPALIAQAVNRTLQASILNDRGESMLPTLTGIIAAQNGVPIRSLN